MPVSYMFFSTRIGMMDESIGYSFLTFFLFQDEEFVVVLEEGAVPRTHNTRGSNYCFINVFPDRIPGRAIVISVVCFMFPILVFLKIYASKFHVSLNVFYHQLTAKLLNCWCRLIILWRELQVKPYRILMWWWDFQKTQGFFINPCFLSI